MLIPELILLTALLGPPEKTLQSLTHPPVHQAQVAAVWQSFGSATFGFFFFFYRRSLAGQGNFSKLSLLGGCEVPSPGLILAVETQVGTMGFQGFVGCNAPCSETWECHSLEVVVVMVLGGSS